MILKGYTDPGDGTLCVEFAPSPGGEFAPHFEYPLQKGVVFTGEDGDSPRVDIVKSELVGPELLRLYVRPA